jgi:hypothetical protein
MRSLTIGAIAVLSLSLSAAQGANVINITDLDNDVTTTYPTVSGVPTCNGTTITSTCVTNVSNFSSDGLSFTYVSDVVTAPNQTGTYVTRIFDPASEGGGLSDYLTFTIASGGFDINVKLCSSGDVEGGGSLSCLPVPTPSGPFGSYLPQDGSIETGRPQLVAQYVYVSNGGEIDDFTLASEVSPEPGTLFLLGTGLAGVVIAARKRRNRA